MQAEIQSAGPQSILVDEFARSVNAQIYGPYRPTLRSSDLRQQDKLGEFSKFGSPPIWDGRMYRATLFAELQVYRLC